MTRWTQILMLLLLFVVLTGCASASTESSTSQAENKTTTVTDDYGHEVTIAANPRIIALGFEDALLSLGVKPIVQWGTTENQFHNFLQSSLGDLPKLDAQQVLQPENIINYQPDLIVLRKKNAVTDDVYERLSKIAPVYLYNPENSNWRKELQLFGKILNKEELANEKIANYDKKAQATKERIQQKIGDKKFAVVQLSGKNLFVYGTEYREFTPILYQDLGLTPAEYSKGKNAPRTSLEMLPEIDADYIFLIKENMQNNQAAESILNSQVWQQTNVVKQNHVFTIDTNDGFYGAGAITNEQILNIIEQHLTK